MKLTAGEIANLVEGTVEGDPHVMIHGPSRIEEGQPGTISFLSNPKYEQHLYNTNASVVMVHEDFSPVMKINPSLIRVKDVTASVARLFEHYGNRPKPAHFISEHAYIDEQAYVSRKATVDRFAIVEAGASIGDGSVIHPQVYVGKNVSIGDNTIIHPGVKIYHDCIIGSNCEIHSNAVIGSDGFGFSRNDDQSYKKVPQIGNVIIEDDVEIGSNTVVDRATLGSTILRQGVKLDNLIQIAHNVDVGKDTAMAAQVGVAGSTKIGERCIIGGQVGIVGHLKIADGAMIQAQSGIAGNVKEENAKLYGYPAIDYQRYLKSYAYFKALPDMATDMRKMKQELIALKKELENKNNPEK